MPAKGLKELVAWLKANPNKASAGIAVTSFRPETAFFQKETGTQFTLIPYRGGAPAVQDLAAGQIDLLFNTPDVLPIGAGSEHKCDDKRRARHTGARDPNFRRDGTTDAFLLRLVRAFRQRIRQGRSSTGSMGPRCWHWPIRR
jgi:hypothetical protein